MIDLDKIFQDHIDHITGVHLAHKESCRKAMEWWKENATNPSSEAFYGHTVKYNGVLCMVQMVHVSGAPMYICEFRLMPLKGEDIGNGHGVSFLLKF